MGTNFDVVIIGAGQAGEPLSKALPHAGKSVALVESAHLGGSCVNFGCTPTKAVIASARVAYLARHASEFGIEVGPVKPDFKAVLDRARKIVGQSQAFLHKSLADQGNPELIWGHARLAGREGDRFKISVGERTVTAAQVVLDTGTRTRIPRIAGLAGC